MQKTTFPYEILIHDDASTDRTTDIIKEYANTYPDLIKPIYQNENQYSQGVNITDIFISPRIQGEYVATCEGDDYWIDSNKLQKQFDFLEMNPEYDTCFHAVTVVDISKNPKGSYLGPKGKGSREYSIKDTVMGGAFHASSRFTRSKYYTNKRPEWMKNAIHGDYAFALYLSAEGRVFFMDEVMSAYRKNVENSVMTNFRKYYTVEKDVEYHKNRIETLEMADKFYDYKYHKEIDKVNSSSELRIVLLENKYSVGEKKVVKKYIKYYGRLNYIKKYLGLKFPRAYKYLVNVKHTLKGLDAN